MKGLYVFFLIMLIFFINKASALYLLAVTNETGLKIEFNVYLVENDDHKTDVFFSSQSFISPDTQFSINLAKDVVCSLFPKKCDNYDFLIKIHSSSPLLTGPSGGAAFATGMLMALFNLPDKEVGITGTINPGGIIGPVGGVDKKVESALDLNKVIIPLGQKNYRDPFTNKTKNLNYQNVYEAGTIFDILKIVWGLDIKFNFSNLTVPNWYKENMKEIASSLCSKVNKLVDDSLDYYSQASYCFRELNEKLFRDYSNLDKEKLLEKAKELENNLEILEKKIKQRIKNLNGLNELQLYMIIYKRINDAKDNLARIKNITEQKELVRLVAYSEARIISVEEWSKFLNNLPKGNIIDFNKLETLCKKNYEFVKHYQNQILGLLDSSLFLSFFRQIELNIKKLENYLDKDPILCIAYAKEIKSSLDYLSVILYMDANLINTFFNNTNEITEFYLKQNQEFPIMAYSYWKYANEIVKKEKDYYLAINYNYLAMNLATMIYEISDDLLSNKEKLIIVEKKKKDYKTFIVYLFLVLVIIYYLIILKNVFKV
ncbi:MAG TPA: hypothetical protein EYH54_00975 [Nautiliaceae bacterium]|nr:hypothetical protein [Nautiliaceae bacterium]